MSSNTRDEIVLTKHGIAAWQENCAAIRVCLGLTYNMKYSTPMEQLTVPQLGFHWDVHPRYQISHTHKTTNHTDASIISISISISIIIIIIITAVSSSGRTIGPCRIIRSYHSYPGEHCVISPGQRNSTG